MRCEYTLWTYTLHTLYAHTLQERTCEYSLCTYIDSPTSTNILCEIHVGAYCIWTFEVSEEYGMGTCCSDTYLRVHVSAWYTGPGNALRRIGWHSLANRSCHFGTRSRGGGSPWLGLPPSSSDEESQHYWTMSHSCLCLWWSLILMIAFLNAPASQEEPFVPQLQPDIRSEGRFEIQSDSISDIRSNRRSKIRLNVADLIFWFSVTLDKTETSQFDAK